MTSTATPFTATTLGSPRIGPRRELKRAVEKYWRGSLAKTELEAVAAGIRRDTWESLQAAGIDSIPRAGCHVRDDVTAVLGRDRRLPRRFRTDHRAPASDPVDRRKLDFWSPERG